MLPAHDKIPSPIKNPIQLQTKGSQQKKKKSFEEICPGSDYHSPLPTLPPFLSPASSSPVLLVKSIEPRRPAALHS